MSWFASNVIIPRCHPGAVLELHAAPSAGPSHGAPVASKKLRSERLRNWVSPVLTFVSQSWIFPVEIERIGFPLASTNVMNLTFIS